MRTPVSFLLLFIITLSIAQVAILPYQVSAEAPVLPPITANVSEIITADMGPTAPVVVAPGEAFQATLLKEYTISGGYIWTVKAEGGKLRLLNYTVEVSMAGPGTITVKLSGDVEEGLYDLVLIGAGTYPVPRSVWVVKSLPSVIRIVENTDLHFITGQPNPTVGDMNRFAAAVITNLLNPTLVVWLGDIADQASVAEYKMAQAYRASYYYNLPIFGVPGNHDGDGSNYAKYLGPTKWYRIIANRLLIVGVFSTEQGYPSWEDLAFLTEVLERHSNIPIKMVLVHHPPFYYQGEVVSRYDDENLRPYVPGGPATPVSSYWSNNMTALRYFLKLLEDYNVTYVLSGHTHRDFFTRYVSTRTNTVTLLMTFTTSAHGSASYDGVGVFELNLETGEISFPIKTPWFHGWGKSQYGNLALNSIPIGIYPPRNNLGWEKMEYTPMKILYSNAAYSIYMSNKLNWTGFSGQLLFSLPWNGTEVNFRTAGSISFADYKVIGGRLYILLNVELQPGSSLNAFIYVGEDRAPPRVSKITFSRKVPLVNISVTIYVELGDEGWGIDPSSVVVTINGSKVQHKLIPETLTEKLNSIYVMVDTVIKSAVTTNVTLTIYATDLAGNEINKTYIITYFTAAEAPSSPKIYEYEELQPTTTPSPTPTPTTTPSPTPTTTPSPTPTPTTSPTPTATTPAPAPVDYTTWIAVAVIVIIAASAALLLKKKPRAL